MTLDEYIAAARTLLDKTKHANPTAHLYITQYLVAERGLTVVQQLMKLRAIPELPMSLQLEITPIAIESLASVLWELLFLYCELSRHDEAAVIKHAQELFVAKNKDYGDATEMFGVLGVLVRLGDKFSRIRALSGGMTPAVEEKVTETIIDAINYCIFVQVFISRSVNP